MGLDMYLFKADKKIKGENLDNGDHKLDEVAYWRKANAIHKWFMTYCDNLENNDSERFKLVTRYDINALLTSIDHILYFVRGNKSKSHKDGWTETEDDLCKPDLKCDKIDVCWDEDVHLTDDGLEYAESTIPSEPGFFFGHTDYDSWYIGNLIETRNQLKEVLSEYDEDKDILIYHAWW